MAKNNTINLNGKHIYLRKISHVEANEPLTLDKIYEFESIIGQSILKLGLFNKKVFGGYMLAKYPSFSKTIVYFINDDIDMYDVLGKNDNHKVLSTLCEFINLTDNTLYNINLYIINAREQLKK